MTEATETTFFQGFFGKEMSENLTFVFGDLYIIGFGYANYYATKN